MINADPNGVVFAQSATAITMRFDRGTIVDPNATTLRTFYRMLRRFGVGGQ